MLALSKTDLTAENNERLKNYVSQRTLFLGPKSILLDRMGFWVKQAGTGWNFRCLTILDEMLGV